MAIVLRGVVARRKLGATRRGLGIVFAAGTAGYLFLHLSVDLHHGEANSRSAAAF